MLNNTNLTRAQKAALKWLVNRNGDGLFDRNNVLVAAGERAPVMRSTWSRLEKLGFVERYHHNNKRLRVTSAARALDLVNVDESEGCADAGDHGV